MFSPSQVPEADAELKARMELLTRERNLLRRLINQLPEELFVKDRDGRIVIANEAKVKGLGFLSEADLVGKTVFDIFSPETAESFRRDELRVTDGGETLMDYRQWTVLRDGVEKRFSDSKIPIFDSKGAIEGYLGIWRDITEAQLIHHDLLHEKALMQSFFDYVPNRIYFKDEEGRYLRVNRAFLLACGLTDEKEALGRTAFDFFEKEYAEKTRRDEMEIIGSGKLLLGMIERQPRKEGKVTWSITSEMPLRNPEGKIIGTMGISHDITELRRAEEALRESEALFRSVWDKSRDGMRLTDDEGIIIAVNEAFCRLYGRKREEIVGRSLADLYAAEEAVGSVAGYKQRFVENSESGGIQLRKKLWDGRKVDLEVSYSRLEPAPGHHLYLSILRDVTQRKKQELQQQNLERKFLEAQRLESLGLMAGGVAHDFNNMLTGIFGHLSLALMKLPHDSPARAELERVERICVQSSELCRKMLVYSGGNRFEIAPVNLNDMLCDLGDLLEISLPKSVQIQYHWHPSLPVVQADLSQLRQVAFNLVINAAEAIGEHPGQIHVSTGVCEVDEARLQDCRHDGALPGRYAYLEVSDTGCGMSKETRSRIFEPFYTTKFTGRGLGLAAVLGIVKGHRGALFLQSEPGKGSLFRLLLPCTSESSPGAAPESPFRSSAKGGGLLLVVDDEEAIRLVVSRMLESHGYEIVPARDGREAVQIFLERPADWQAVIMDRTMPHMSGDEAAVAMREVREDLPMLLMSGYSAQDSARPLSIPGRCLFLAKPFRLEDLLEKLDQVLRKPA